MSEKPSGAKEQSVVVNQLIAEFMSRSDAGDTLAPEQFIATHPEHAEELKKHFANVDLLEGWKETGPAGTAETMAASRDPGEISTEDATANTIVSVTADSETSVSRDHHQQNTGSATNIDIPETFDRYAIQKVLGQGAMGAVYLAKDTQLDRDVALKIPKFGDGNGVDDEELLARFYREARASATLRSPNICPVFDVGEIDGQHYITMAYIEGRPLKDFTQSKKSHSEKQIITTIRKLAVGLAQAHKIGVIHRDLKPANIMVDKQGEPVVMDFGLARRSASDDVQVTHSGVILGTPAYMAPEQVAGDQAAIDHQVDIYALGIIMYELITGEMPFKGNLMAILQQIALNNPKKPSELRKDIDPRLETICLKMMAGDQSKRYQSMTDVAADLLDVLRNPGKRQKKEQAKKTGPKPTSIPSANEESNPALISVAQPKSVAAELRDKKSKAAKKTKSTGKASPKSVKTASVGSSSSGPPKKFLIAGGLGGLLLLLGTIFLVRVGKYDVQITREDPSITLSVDGEVLNITDGKEVYKLPAGEHKLQLQKEGLKTHVEDFTVTKNGKTTLRAIVVNDRLDGLLNGEEPSQFAKTRPGNTHTKDKPESPSEANHRTEYALEFDSVGDLVTLSNSGADLTSPLTFEMWVASDPPPDSIFARRHLAKIGLKEGLISIDLRYNLSEQYKTSLIPVILGSTNFWTTANLSASDSGHNEWMHIAITWTGSEMRTYINGLRRWGTQNPFEDTGLRLTQGTLTVLGGVSELGKSFQGRIRELRISKSIRYRKDFELPPPDVSFTDDDKTFALYHFDEGNGDVLKDSSGNGHDGKIIGAKWVSVDRGTDSPLPPP